MKNRIKELYFWLLIRINGHHFFRFISRKKILIVMYHGIVKDPMPIPCWWQLPYNLFKWQLEYLNKYYTVMHLTEVIQKIKNKEKLPDNVAIITFDDGFKNNYSTAFPLLKELKLPASIFLTTDLIGTDQLIWTDEIFLMLAQTKVKSIDLRKFGLDIIELSPEKALQVFNIVGDKLKSLNLEDKNAMFTYIKNTLCTQINVTTYNDHFKLLSWADVEAMNSSGLIQWGAHSATHQILSRLDDPSLNDEIKNSCAKISTYGQQILFAYPNGRQVDFDERAQNILKEFNALCSLTTISGLNTYSQDLYELKRIGVGHDMTHDRFKLLCSGVL